MTEVVTTSASAVDRLPHAAVGDLDAAHDDPAWRLALRSCSALVEIYSYFDPLPLPPPERVRLTVGKLQ